MEELPCGIGRDGTGDGLVGKVEPKLLNDGWKRIDVLSAVVVVVVVPPPACHML